MRSLGKLAITVLLLAGQNSLAKFEAHEWGTFTSLVGSDGITQDGMYHEDEKLPEFVHGFGAIAQPEPPPAAPPPRPAPLPPPDRPCRGKGCFDFTFYDSNVITQKMETPVIYFYTDARRTVTVNVRFPEGVVTETYPAPIATSPSRGNIREAKNGNTTFRVDVFPEMTGNLPFVANDNIYGHARNVASNVLRSGNEVEKFIFYRGIGKFQPRLGMKSEGGHLYFQPERGRVPVAAFLVHVDGSGYGQMFQVQGLSAGRQTVVSRGELDRLSGIREPYSHYLRGARMGDALVNALESAGLYTDEARAMVKTWEHGYLKVPGLRLLYVLPRTEVDTVLPLTITPVPESVERAFVARIEILRDTEEQSLVERVKSDTTLRASDFGRFAEPILRRLKQVYEKTPTDPLVLSRFTRLIEEAKAGE